jgi:hypothetical protein
MKAEDVCNEQVGQFLGIDVSAAWDEVSFLGKSVYHNPNCVVAI